MSEKADWVEALETGSLELRREAAERLAQMPDRIQWNPGCGVLVRAAADEDEAVREWAVAALEGMGAPHEDDVQDLAQIVQSGPRDAGYWAATLLGRLGPRSAPAVPQLAAALTSESELVVRQRVAWALGQIGPAARSAESALRSAAQSTDPRLARLATESLKQTSADG